MSGPKDPMSFKTFRKVVTHIAKDRDELLYENAVIKAERDAALESRARLAAVVRAVMALVETEPGEHPTYSPEWRKQRARAREHLSALSREDFV